jgi:hypothetical protein
MAALSNQESRKVVSISTSSWSSELARAGNGADRARLLRRVQRPLLVVIGA